MIETIAVSDSGDPRIQSFRGVRDADLRGRDGLFCVESPRVLRRFLHAIAAACAGAVQAPRVELHSVLATPEVLDDLAPQLDAAMHAAAMAPPIYSAPASLLCDLAGYRMHQGALALGRRPVTAGLDALVAALSPRDDLLVTLGVVHTDNVGAAFRNAGSLGDCGILLAGGSSDPLHRKAIRVSSGRVFSVSWGVSENWERDLAALRERHGFALIAAEDAPESIPLARLHECDAVRRSVRAAIVLGAEGSGLSGAARALCDVVCAVPMREPGGLVEAGDRPSLNVAVASALVLHGVRNARAHARTARL